jgi:hypothetical protein
MLFADSDTLQIVSTICGCITTVGLAVGVPPIASLQSRTKNAVDKGAKETTAAVQTGADATNAKLDEHGIVLNTVVTQTNGMSHQLAALSEAKGRADQKEDDRKSEAERKS